MRLPFGGLGRMVSIVDRNAYAGSGLGCRAIRSPRTRLVGCRRGSSGYRVLLAFVPRHQGPCLSNSLLQYGGERPEIDCRTARKAAEPPCSRTTGRPLKSSGLRSALSSPRVGWSSGQGRYALGVAILCCAAPRLRATAVSIGDEPADSNGQQSAASLDGLRL